MIERSIRRLHIVYLAILVLLGGSLAVEMATWYGLGAEQTATPAQLVATATHGVILAMLFAVALFWFRPTIKILDTIHRNVAEREAQLNRILTTAVEGYAVIDPHTYKYRRVNQALCDMLGYSKMEMLGKTPIDFSMPEGQRVLRAQASTITQTRTRQYQVVMRHRDGHPVYTQYNANTVWGDDGTPEMAFAFITNVTNIKNTEAALRQAKEEAEEATRLKDQFVSLIAHDLRNPIGAIRAYIELMMMDAKGDLTDEHKEQLSFMFRQCTDLLDMINDLLDLSRLQSGKVNLDRTFFDFHYLTETIFHRLQLQAQNKGVELVNDVPVHTRVHGDETLLAQVLQNLVSNAIKFSNTNCRVRVFKPQGDGAAFAVEDQGVGIPPTKIVDLFNAEKHTSTNGTAGEGGSGFGLPLSYQIVKAHGGDVDVQSTVGDGTSFIVTLPTRDPVVLVADDDEQVRSYLRALLEDLGLRVVEAANGREALDAVNPTDPPHLLITDVVMPGMDGMELLRTLKTMLQDTLMPVIVLTGEGDQGVREQCLGLGASDFMQKPVRPGELVSRVRHFVG